MLATHPSDVENALATLGWTMPDDQPHPYLRNHLHTHASHDLKLNRAYSPAGRYQSLPRDNVIRCLLFVEGDAKVTYSGEPADTPPGTFVLMSGEDDSVAEAKGDCARFYWEVDAGAFNTTELRALLGEPLEAAYPQRQALVEISNVLLQNQPNPETREAAGFAGAISHLIRGMVPRRQQKRNHPADLHRFHLLSEAIAVIEENYHRPTFTVAGLARKIRVSEPSLRRLFRTMGSTPNREIQQYRTRHAGKLLDALDRVRATDAEEVAHASGFNSRAHLWRTLRKRQSGADEPQGSTCVTAHER